MCRPARASTCSSATTARARATCSRPSSTWARSRASAARAARTSSPTARSGRSSRRASSPRRRPSRCRCASPARAGASSPWTTSGRAPPRPTAPRCRACSSTRATSRWPAAPPETRRAFLDRILEQMDPTYARASQTYRKALRSRNRLLKAPRPDRRSIVAYDELLASAGAVLGESRSRLAADLEPRVEDAFREVAGEELPLEVAYRPRVQPTVEAIRRALAASLEKDLARGFTVEGPHGDDLALRVRERGARHAASQGQHRMMALALKVAELDVLTRRTGRVPVLLLDDVSSELDATRNQRLFVLLDRLGGQVFLTTTQRELIRLDAGRVDFRLSAGRVEPA
ncbi:MAG: DNA replication and repair protein RecF [Sandaracinaceae bacterium]|nr:DNA replication and repair protein RecF [Sandaracinaceae bacterium]